jgi:hypothetical protein
MTRSRQKVSCRLKSEILIMSGAHCVPGDRSSSPGKKHSEVEPSAAAQSKFRHKSRYRANLLTGAVANSLFSTPSTPRHQHVPLPISVSSTASPNRGVHT